MPSTRVWVKQGLNSHRSAQVLLVPLGNISPDVYAKYCEILRRFSTIPMQNLTAPGDWNRQNGALKHFSWSEGCFNFHFIDQDTTDGGPSEWEDYQAYRRVVGVIGVVHFPSCEGGRADFKELEKQLDTVVSGYKHVTATRMFAFGHSFEQGDYPDILDPQRDIVFPPEQEFEDGGSTTELHMAVSLYDVAVSIVKSLAADVKTWSASASPPSAAGRAVAALRGTNASGPPLTSWYEPEEGLSDSKNAKRRAGRLHKWIGDTCLLLGSPKDALEHYSQSMSETKASSDPLWHAGCLEGYAACLSAMSDADHPTVHGDQALALLRDMAKDKGLEKAGQQEGSSTWTVLAEAVVSEKCEEALTVLSRCPPLGALEVELCFKTARFHACAQPNPRWEQALAALLRALSVPDMPMQVQLERSIEAAVLCEGMGLKRKAALFAHLSAMLCSDFETWNTAHLLARMAGEGYGALLLPSPPPPPGPPPPPPQQQGSPPGGAAAAANQNQGRASAGAAGDASPLAASMIAPLEGEQGGAGAGGGGGGGGWLVLRKHLLQWLLAVSARCGDVRASSEYFAGLAELTAALEEERSKADRYLVTLPLPPSEGVSPGGGMLPPVPLVMEALGNVAVAPGLSAAPLTASTREGKVSWSDRMMRRATAEGPPPVASAQAQQALLPPTPATTTHSSFSSTTGGAGGAGGGAGGGAAGGSASRDAFLGTGHARTPTAPASPIHQRFENLASEFLQPASSSSAATTAASKKSRKISLPKSIGRKIHASRGGSVLSRTKGPSFPGTAPPASSPDVGGGGGGVVCAVAHRAALTLEEQWETLSDMAQCTSRLTAHDAARVQLSGIPRLESARLLHFDGSLALLPGDGAAAAAAAATVSETATNNALFYNPFEDTGPMDADDDMVDGSECGSGGGDIDDPGGESGRRSSGQAGGDGGGGGAELPARWAAGETGRVVARFSNPLQVPLKLESITAVVDGARVQAFPTSLLLPPRAEFHEVVLFVKPLEDGQVILRGVTVEVLSLVTMCRIDKWGRGISQGPRAPPPRTYKSLRATFRRPRQVLTTDTVDIAADAAAAAAQAEAAAAAVQAEEEGGEGRDGDADVDGEEGGVPVEVIGAGGAVIGSAASAAGGATGSDIRPGDSSGSSGGGGGGNVAAPEGKPSDGGSRAKSEATAASAAGGPGVDEKGPAGGGKHHAGGTDADAGGSVEAEVEEEEEEEEEEPGEEEDEEEFSGDARMRKGETACRKLRVEGAAPIVRLLRASPPTSEALAGEEIEEVLELVNEGGPPVGVMEVWTRPRRAPGAPLGKPPSPAMSLLFSLAGAIKPPPSAAGQAATAVAAATAVTAATATPRAGVGGAVSCLGLDVALAAPVGVSDGVVAGGGVGPGEAVKLGLTLSTGQAGDRDVVTEVLVKYSEKEGAAFHRQLRLPLRVAIRGGLRVCSLRVAQFLGGGLSFEGDADATECLLLLELANDSTFPVFSWRSRRRRQRQRPAVRASGVETTGEGGIEAGGDFGGGDLVEIPGGSRRCLPLRIPRLRVRPEGKSTGSDEPRSPLSLRPLFEWEKSLASHLLDEVSLRWSTSRDEAAAAAAAATTTAVGPSVSGALTQHEEGPAGTDGGGAEGGSWKPGRRGRVRIALDQIGDDGGCRLLGTSGGGSGGKGSVVGRGSGPLRPPRHPEAVPECLLGALLPPVRLSCVPFAFDAGGKGGALKGLVDAGRFPRIGVSEAGQVQLDGTAEGLAGVEGEWAAKTMVDSFLPVSLVVHNSSPWPIDVIVEVTSTCEGREEEGSTSWGDDDVDDSGGGVMWSGMPRRRLGKLAPGRSMCHGLLACFLTPGKVSVGFTCRVKVESASAPYGSATYASASSAAAAPGAAATTVRGTTAAGVGEAGDDWHPVACHLPLTVSVLPRVGGVALGAGEEKAEVHRLGPRIGGSPADCDDASWGSSEDASDAPPAGLERL